MRALSQPVMLYEAGDGDRTHDIQLGKIARRHGQTRTNRLKVVGFQAFYLHTIAKGCKRLQPVANRGSAIDVKVEKEGL